MGYGLGEPRINHNGYHAQYSGYYTWTLIIKPLGTQTLTFIKDKYKFHYCIFTTQNARNKSLLKHVLDGLVVI